jgi:tetratricopeptide (TPR) repeat protein
MRTSWFVLCAVVFTASAHAVDLAALWDFNDPALSEQRFRSALQSAAGDEALIIQTQIARTYMLRKDFGRARDLLHAMAPNVDAAGPEVKVRYWLELGRTYASSRHSPESQTPETKQLARDAYTKALTLAKEAKLDGLAIDVIHMFAFVDTAPADQLKWNLQALSLVAASNHADAKRWEASICSNTGEALYDLGRYDEAMTYFRRALALREQGANTQALRDAHWHVARVLRVQNRLDEALAIQLRLERESESAREPRYYIFEELELIYRAQGKSDRAQYYADRAKAIRS